MRWLFNSFGRLWFHEDGNELARRIGGRAVGSLLGRGNNLCLSGDSE